MRQCRYSCKENYLREIANDIALWEILANKVFGNLNNKKKDQRKVPADENASLTPVPAPSRSLHSETAQPSCTEAFHTT